MPDAKTGPIVLSSAFHERCDSHRPTTQQAGMRFCIRSACEHSSGSHNTSEHYSVDQKTSRMLHGVPMEQLPDSRQQLQPLWLGLQKVKGLCLRGKSRNLRKSQPVRRSAMGSASLSLCHAICPNLRPRRNEESHAVQREGYRLLPRARMAHNLRLPLRLPRCLLRDIEQSGRSREDPR